MTHTAPQLVWFKRDLRILDHDALARAAAAGPVLPLLVIEPDWWTLPDASGRHYAFFRECAAELADALAGIGLALHVHVGDVLDVLDRALARHGPFTLWAHQETGNAWSFARDRAVRRWIRDRGLSFHEAMQSGVWRGARLDRDRWARDWDAVMAAPQAMLPARVTGLTLPGAAALPDAVPGMAHDPCPGRQQGGRAAGLETLDTFLMRRGRNYRTDMSSPISGATGCSRLSAHFAWGSVSIREAYQATRARRAALADDPSPDAAAWRASLASYIGRLHWHCHFTQKLEAEPEMEWRPTARSYEGMRPAADPDVLAAFATGRTGFPFVDACMRQLAATGWINFRMRAMLMSFACYDLFLPWQAAGTVLARLFTDYDPGIHWPQSQMQSGETGINTLRIYSTVKQGRDHDPDGAYIRRWVPELAGIHPDGVHEPWTVGGVAGYPPPLVDSKAAQKAARDAIWAIRRTPVARAEADAIVARHGSRRRPPRRRPTPGAAATPRTRRRKARQEQPADDL